MVEIDNEALLSNLFGHWPDFHDAEIFALILAARDHSAPAIDIEVEVAGMSSEIDERGFYRDRQRARAMIRFHNVARVRLTDFLDQNVMSSLELAHCTSDDYDEFFGKGPEGRRKFKVQWESAIGSQADFLCDSIEVLSAAPFARTT
jgi:hypothetical protein